MDSKDRFTIEDLVTETGLSRRTIRFYVERGLLAPPAGRGRGGFYDMSHLARLLEIKHAREAGHSLESIREVEPGRLMEVAENFQIAALECGCGSGQPSMEPSRLLRWELAPGLSLHVEEGFFPQNRDLIDALISTVQHHEHGTLSRTDDLTGEETQDESQN